VAVIEGGGVDDKVFDLMPSVVDRSLNLLTGVAAGQRSVKKAMLAAKTRAKDAVAFLSEDFFFEKTGYPFSGIIPQDDLPILVQCHDALGNAVENGLQ